MSNYSLILHFLFVIGSTALIPLELAFGLVENLRPSAVLESNCECIIAEHDFQFTLDVSGLAIYSYIAVAP
jgi:hypothetical protein|tara:strand:+ start:17315 stop:17527 length:213 start_codon:yes stop_codon:yes gene_type:complete